MASGSIDLGANTGNAATNLTQGSVVFAGANGVLSQDNANLFWDDTNNYLGIGISSPAAPLDIEKSFTSATVSELDGGLINITVQPSADNAGDRFGINSQVTIPAGNTHSLNQLYGLVLRSSNAGTGSVVGGMAGFRIQCTNTGNASFPGVLEADSFILSSSSGTSAFTAITENTCTISGGTTTELAGTYIFCSSPGGANAFRAALWIDDAGDTNATVRYAIYSLSPDQSYLAGNLGVGVTVPSYKLDVAGDIATRTAGQGFRIKEGSNARMGTSVLSGGTVVVSNTSVTANTRIFLTTNTVGGTPGFLTVSARSASTSFTILSSNGADTSTVAWLLFEPA